MKTLSLLGSWQAQERLQANDKLCTSVDQMVWWAPFSTTAQMLLGSFSKRVLRTCGIAGRVRVPRVWNRRIFWHFCAYIYTPMMKSLIKCHPGAWGWARCSGVLHPAFFERRRQNWQIHQVYKACLHRMQWGQPMGVVILAAEVIYVFLSWSEAVWVRMRMSSWPHAAHKSRGAKESQASETKGKNEWDFEHSVGVCRSRLVILLLPGS